MSMGPRGGVCWPPVLESKLAPPRAGVAQIMRPELTERIAHTQAPLTIINAPAGFGKTTLLRQSADALERPHAWVSLDPSDDDARTLMTDIATAINRIIPIDPIVFRQLQSPLPTVGAEVVSSLLNSLGHAEELVLLLDDVHHVRSWEAANALANLCDHGSPVLRLVLSSREAPRLPVARQRACGQTLELGSADLAFSAAEARELLELANLSLDPDVFDLLYERTEGWPAGLYLATLTARESPNPGRAIRQFGGDDRNVFDYLSSELLTRQSAEELSFLLRTSVLDRFSASLCDAVLDRADAASILAQLEQMNLFLVPLDSHRGWYRYHHLLEDALRTGLARVQPQAEPELHLRASRWYEQHGDASEAIEHALAGHDCTRATELLANTLWDLYDHGQQMRIRRWLDAFSDADLAACPPLAAGAAWVMGMLGERPQTRRYLNVLEQSSCSVPFPLGEQSAESALVLLKAGLGWQGVSQMRAQSELAYRFEGPGNPARAHAALFLGLNQWLRGRTATATELLEEATSCGDEGANSLFAFGVLGLMQLGARKLDEAHAWIRKGLAIMERYSLQDYLGASAVVAARALLRLERGERALAGEDLDHAVSLLPHAAAMPWWSITLRILTGRAARALGRLDQSESLLAEARRELARYPDAGVLPQLLSTEERALEAALGGAGGLCEPLTEAERRVLVLAPTHLTLEEIGRDRCISRNTVKSHLRAIYSKLSVTSRGEAVARAQALGLLRAGDY